MNVATEHRVDTDVAIIGGGMAGLNAALAAAENGVRVLIADKANIARSGSLGGGMAHFMAYLQSGAPWDTRESYLKYVAGVAKGASNLDIQETVYCDELPGALERIERIGISLRSPFGGQDYFRTQSSGMPGPLFINFNGKKLKPKMTAALRQRGCQVLERLQVTRLFLHDKMFAGFSGFNIRTGEFYTIRAKTVVISAGNTNRMFRSQTGNPFHLEHCPACTGDLHRAAFDAGVELANMEYLPRTIVPQGFSSPAFNAFIGLGAHLVNAKGKAFMVNDHPLGDQAPLNQVVWSTMGELKKGRGPIYMDCRHLSETERSRLLTLLGYEKDPLPDFFSAKGYDLAKDLVEMTVSEPMPAGPSGLCGSGIKIDRNCAANVPGIYAAGDGSDQMGGLHMGITGGYAAGKKAAEYARSITTHLDPDPKEIAEEKAGVFRPLTNGHVRWNEFEETVRCIATNHFGPDMTETSLTGALEKLSNLDSVSNDLQADNLHELMRVHEAVSIHRVAKMTATAARERQESRFKPCHYRADYPETDDQHFCGLIVIKKGEDGGMTTRFEPLTYGI